VPKPRRKQQTNSVRIIGGEFRGRRLAFVDSEGLRPSTDRNRETLFNWLQSYVAGANCLDLFAGSGALGFECISRGAANVTFVDQEKSVCRQLKENLSLLKVDTASIHCGSALSFLAQYKGSGFDLVFLDPPFHRDLLQDVCLQLAKSAILLPSAHIYLEAEYSLEQLVLPDNWQLIRNKRAGAVNYGLAIADQGFGVTNR